MIEDWPEVIKCSVNKIKNAAHPMRNGISLDAASRPRNLLNCERSYHRRRERSEIACDRSTSLLAAVKRNWPRHELREKHQSTAAFCANSATG